MAGSLLLELRCLPNRGKELESCWTLHQRHCQSIRLVNVGIQRHKHKGMPAHACVHTHTVTQHSVRHPCFNFRTGSAAPALLLRVLSRPSHLLWHKAGGCIRGCERNNVWKLKWTSSKQQMSESGSVEVVWTWPQNICNLNESQITLKVIKKKN